MSRSFLIALLLLIAPLRLLAQIEVRGQVEDAKTKEPIALASVTLVSERDSTLVLRGATDLQGAISLMRSRSGAIFSVLASSATSLWSDGFVS